MRHNFLRLCYFTLVGYLQPLDLILLFDRLLVEHVYGLVLAPDLLLEMLRHQAVLDFHKFHLVVLCLHLVFMFLNCIALFI